MPRRLNEQARSRLRRALIGGGLEVSAVLKALGLFGNARGSGVIFTLHHVRPKRTDAFQPNAFLEVTPDFLERAILSLGDAGYDFVPLETIPERLAKPAERPFACFTLDDGYRDNAAFAAPVFTRHGVPFTIFLTRGFVDASRSMWWETLDSLVAKAPRLSFDFGNGPQSLAATTRREKTAAFNRIATYVNTTNEMDAVARLDATATEHGVAPLQITRDEAMRADELKTLIANPLVAFGGHSVTHRGLARLSTREVEAEIARSMEMVEALAGTMPKAFAYPYGDARSVTPQVRDILRKLGVVIGVTTRPGTLRGNTAADLTAIPRISLNGLYQKARYVSALASGIPFEMMRIAGVRQNYDR